MKNIFKLLFVFIAAGALLMSCNKETNHAMLTVEPDANATYYLQFIDAAQSGETGVSLDGGLIEIESTVSVALMGMPQSADITVDLVLDASSTIDPSMYVLGANSITIPAGQTSGSVTFSTIAANMPVGETVKFVLNMDAGVHNSPNAVGTQVNYTLKRIEFCPLPNGAADLAGSWGGLDAFGFGADVTASVNSDGVNLDIYGLSFGFIENWWGEPVIAGGTFKATFFGNGIIEIPRQYIYTTTWAGAPYDYEIAGSGKWTNCGDSPTLLIAYDIYYPGDMDGLGKKYANYYDGTPYFVADLTLDGKKRVENVKVPMKIER